MSTPSSPDNDQLPEDAEGFFDNEENTGGPGYAQFIEVPAQDEEDDWDGEEDNFGPEDLPSGGGEAATADERTISAAAGAGGPGCVAFHREKYIDRGGPDGGDGGRGGDVYIRVNTKLKNLGHLHPRKKYKAGAGENGRRNKCHGADGADLIIDVPMGTEVYNADTGKLIADFDAASVERGERFGKKIRIAAGGKGGKGNPHFATSTNQAPRYAQPGLPGEGIRLRLNLKLIADIGLVGLPNAGKSTLLAAVTGAHPKIGDYAFTTLKPNIGVLSDERYNQYTVADIPGIIEGASQGHGLGLSFLRHIERVRALIFLIDIGSPDIPAEYELLKQEMAHYNPIILEKPRALFLNKCDALDDSAFVADLTEEVTEALSSDERLVKVAAISAKENIRLQEAVEVMLNLASVPPATEHTQEPAGSTDTTGVETGGRASDRTGNTAAPDDQREPGPAGVNNPDDWDF